MMTAVAAILRAGLASLALAFAGALALAEESYDPSKPAAPVAEPSDLAAASQSPKA